MKTAIDWAAKRQPWCWIGPSFRIDVERICAGMEPTPGPVPSLDPAGLQLMGRRVEAKLTLVQLARKVGCTSQMIGKLESGKSSVSAALWAKIDAALAEALINQATR